MACAVRVHGRHPSAAHPDFAFIEVPGIRTGPHQWLAGNRKKSREGDSGGT